MLGELRVAHSSLLTLSNLEHNMSKPELTAFIDVDDTLIRTVGSKRIPIPATVVHVRDLHAAGVTMYCWSSGGAAYAEEVAAELGIEGCFVAYLPKPNVVVDDQSVSEWRYCRTVHPNECSNRSVEDYVREIFG